MGGRMGVSATGKSGAAMGRLGWLWRYICHHTSAATTPKIAQPLIASRQPRSLASGTTTQAPKPAKVDILKLNTPVASEILSGAYCLINGAVSAFSIPMANDKISVPTYSSITPNQFRIATPNANKSVMPIIIRSSPNFLASTAAINEPNANNGIGIAPR